jgi:hypothetical protein
MAGNEVLDLLFGVSFCFLIEFAILSKCQMGENEDFSMSQFCLMAAASSAK